MVGDDDTRIRYAQQWSTGPQGLISHLRELKKGMVMAFHLKPRNRSGSVDAGNKKNEIRKCESIISHGWTRLDVSG